MRSLDSVHKYGLSSHNNSTLLISWLRLRLPRVTYLLMFLSGMYVVGLFLMLQSLPLRIAISLSILDFMAARALAVHSCSTKGERDDGMGESTGGNIRLHPYVQVPSSPPPAGAYQDTRRSFRT